MDVALVMPKNKSETDGAWVGKAGVYVSNPEGGVVIANCTESKAGNGFIAALVVEKDAKECRLQYADEHGTICSIAVSPETYESAVLGMLDSLVKLAILKKKKVEQL